MPDTDRPVVLVVDDEESVAEAYALWLSEEYDVRIATSGEQALDEMDETVDVVLLDRRMPGLSGDEVLQEIRDRGYDCRVAMVTAVDPDFDIVDMDFDAYLTKPVTKSDIGNIVEQLVALSSYDDIVQREFSLAQKRASLEAQKSQEALESSEEFAELEAELEDLREQVDDHVEEMDQAAFQAAMSDLPGEPE